MPSTGEDFFGPEMCASVECSWQPEARKDLTARPLNQKHKLSN